MQPPTEASEKGYSGVMISMGPKNTLFLKQQEGNQAELEP